MIDRVRAAFGDPRCWWHMGLDDAPADAIDPLSLVCAVCGKLFHTPSPVDYQHYRELRGRLGAGPLSTSR